MSKNNNEGGIIIKKKQIAAISIVSIGVVVGAVCITKSSNAINTQDKSDEAKIARGVQIIKELESQDVIKIEEEINLVQSNLSSEDNSDKVNYIDKFSNSVILGDSRAEGLTGYGILNNSSVVANKGRNLITAEKDGDIQKAINLSPKNVFLTYGINDIGSYEDEEAFANQYKKVIDKIKKQLPNSTIYVNSIFRVSDAAYAKRPEFKKISNYNTALKKMCKNLGVTYIDGSSCVQNDLYEPDGIHFKPQFLKNWLNLLINKANL